MSKPAVLPPAAEAKPAPTAAVSTVAAAAAAAAESSSSSSDEADAAPATAPPPQPSTAPVHEGEELAPQTYDWGTGADSRARMDARRDELLGQEIGGSPELLAEWMKLVMKRSQIESEEVKADATPASGAAKAGSDAASGGKKKGGLFSGWFTSSKADEVIEDVPDHDLDDDGKPLNRIDLLRRQSKRAKMAKLKAERLAASGGEGADADAPVAAGNKLVVDDAAADGAAAVDAEGNQGGGSSSSSSSSSEAEPSFKPTAPVSEVVAAKEPKKSAKKKKRKSGHKASATPAAAPSTDSDSDDVFSERKPKVKPASSSSSSSSDSENEAVASAAVPARTTHRPGVGSELTDHPVVRQLFDELAAVRAEGALMRQQMRALGERVSTMATELAVLRSAPADCDADAAAADRWPWQSVEGPQRSVTLLDRKRELQQQAAPGISDAAAKVAWSQEWTALTRVLEGLQGGDSPPAHMGDAVASGAGGEDAAASDVGFILVVGGRTGTLDPVAYVEQLNLATGEWTVADALVEPRFGLAAAADGRGSAFAIAGSGSRSTNNASVKTVERYDVAAGRWELGQPCSTSRAGAAAVAFEGELYVLGGASDALFGSVLLKSVEKYDAAARTWRAVAPMHTSRGGLAAVVLDQQIYAIGGYDDSVTCLNTVERFEPKTNTWSPVAPMQSPRARLGAAVLGRFIYAVGGYNGSERLQSVERFDPAVGRWESVPAMSFRRDCARPAPPRARAPC